MVKFTVVILLAIGSICIKFSYCNEEINNFDSDKIIFSKLQDKLVNIFDISGIVKQILEKLESLKTEKNEVCINQLEAVLNGLEGPDDWAKRMIDAWGKIPSGILWGNLAELGHFDECLAITQEVDQPIGTIKGQYCLPKIPFDLTQLKPTQSPEMRVMPSSEASMDFRIGMCTPDTCTAEILQALILEMLNINETQFILTDLLCSRNGELEFSALDYFAIVFFSFIGALLLSSTIYDYATTILEKRKNPLLMTFSIITNGRNLFKIKEYNSPDVMECLNGIRCLSITWVVFGHAYMNYMYTPIINSNYLFPWISNYYSMVLLDATISVDSFFLLSGLLVAWSVLRQLDKTGGKLNIPLMYFHRYLRLTPIVAATILYAVTLMKYTSSGPNWKKSLEALGPLCEENWWVSLLYVQNYVRPGAMCLGHSWYLAVDMQLYIVSPLILIPLWKWKRRFIWVIVLLILISISITFTLFMLNDFSISILELNQSRKQELTYFPTHTRMGAWLVGVILGYYLHLIKGRRIKLSKLVVLFGWITSLVVIGLIIWGPYKILQPATPPTTLESAFYESFSRVSWAIALSWIIFACVQGYGGLINSILSLPFWQPFGRLSYSIYILHLVVQLVLLGSVRTSRNFSDFEAIQKFWSDFGLTLSVCVVSVLAFESPIVGLEKLLFNRKPTKTSDSQQQLRSTESLEANNGNASSGVNDINIQQKV